MPETLPENIAAKISRSTPAACWQWLAAKTNGYGVILHEGRIQRAHRVVYTLLCEPVPRGMFLLHRCDNRACVNPAHLFPGTNQANVDDMMRKGRHARAPYLNGDSVAGKYRRGTQHHAAKLTEADVRAIRSARENGESFGSISRRLHLSIGHIYRFVTRKVWRQVA